MDFLKLTQVKKLLIYPMIWIFLFTSGVNRSYASQQDSQNAAQAENQQKANQANILGILAITMGSTMILTGMSSTPENGALIAAGAALVAAGVAALLAAQKMAKNAAIAGAYGQDLSSLNPQGNTQFGGLGSKDPTGIADENGNPLVTGSTSPGIASGIKIDPALFKSNTSAQSIIDEFRKKSGMGAEDLIRGLERGRSLGDILSGAKKGISSAQVNGALSGASSMNSEAVLGKLGISKDELADLAKKSEEFTYEVGASKGLPAPKTTNQGFGDLFGAHENSKDMLSDVLPQKKIDVSPEVKDALQKQEGDGVTLFQRVSNRYKEKSFQMLGVPKREVLPVSPENPNGK
jgi:hypothetical protein